MTTERKVTIEISNLEPAIAFTLLRGGSEIGFTLYTLLMKVKRIYYIFTAFSF